MSYQPTHFDRLQGSLVLNKDDDKQIKPYVFSANMVIAVDVALATDRPLLVSGNPGCGKSQLAEAVAAVQGWNLLSKTITSRTRPESLTVEVDQLRRLNDAQVRGENAGLKPDAYYLNPGVFWWAFQPQTACRRGLEEDAARELKVDLCYPGVDRGNQCHRTVLLIDEIDKAEPDLPNDLLEPLDRRRFDLPDGYQIGDNPQIVGEDKLRLLTVITTNGERDLPQAFIRRCVLLKLPDPESDQLVNIALKHFPEGNAERIQAIAKLIVSFRDRAKKERRRPPGTSEFLDAVHACEELNKTNIEVNDENSVWKMIETAVLLKDTWS